MSSAFILFIKSLGITCNTNLFHLLKTALRLVETYAMEVTLLSPLRKRSLTGLAKEFVLGIAVSRAGFMSKQRMAMKE